MSSPNSSASSSSMDHCTEWSVIHFNEFCPEDEENCSHDLMVEGLEDALEHLENNCKPDNSWRGKQLYGSLKIEYHCLVCQTEITIEERAVGIFNKMSSKLKMKAFVLHDTCLSIISQDKDIAIAALKSRISDAETKEDIEKYSIFENKHTCADCGSCMNNVDMLVTKQDRKIINCADQFCRQSFHWACALRSRNCIVDHHSRVLYCKREHNSVMPKPNTFSLRGELFSQDPSDYEQCFLCRQPVSRWPIRRNVVYLSKCCDRFVHYQCVVNRLKKGNAECGGCGNTNGYVAAIQEQGICVHKYKTNTKNNGRKRSYGGSMEEVKLAKGEEKPVHRESKAKEEFVTKEDNYMEQLNRIRDLSLVKGDKENDGVRSTKNRRFVNAEKV